MNASEARAKIEHQRESRQEQRREVTRAQRVCMGLNAAIRRGDWPRIRHRQEILARHYAVPMADLIKARKSGKFPGGDINVDD